MTDRGRLRKYYERDRSYSGNRLQKYYDRNAKRIHHQSITKMIMKESIIVHFRTMEIEENIKIIIKTSIGMKISMVVIDLMIQIILIVDIGHMTETDHTIKIGHIVETGTTP